MTPEPLDLLHGGAPQQIASYPVETDAGLALFDVGATTTLPALEAALTERGLSLADVSHLLLSHIHLDHAGAAGVIVRRHPHIQVHVSEIGAPHLVDPSRLDAFVAGLSSRDVPITEPWTSPLWHHPLYFLVALLCLTAEWGLRRVNGLA